MNKLTDKTHCLLTRDKGQFWMTEERANSVKNLLSNNKPEFIDLDGEYIRTFHITGIYTAERMADLTHRQNGEWLCDHGYWHAKFEQCGIDTCPGWLREIGRAKLKRDYIS